MLYALSWSIVLVLLALWSLTVWALHAVAAWTVSNAGALTGAASGASGIAVTEWLGPWMPAEAAQWASQLMAGVAPVVDTLLQSVPALAGGLTVASWAIWGIGSVLLVVLGAVAHVLIALWRRSSNGAGGGSGPSAGSWRAAG